MISKARASRCVTHSYGCDCRERMFESMRHSLAVIAAWAKNDALSKESRAKAMNDIAELAELGLAGDASPPRLGRGAQPGLLVANGAEDGRIKA